MRFRAARLAEKCRVNRLFPFFEIYSECHRDGRVCGLNRRAQVLKFRNFEYRVRAERRTLSKENRVLIKKGTPSKTLSKELWVKQTLSKDSEAEFNFSIMILLWYLKLEIMINGGHFCSPFWRKLVKIFVSFSVARDIRYNEGDANW